MNEYEQRQEERRKRLLDRAKKKRDRAKIHSDAAAELADCFPYGQPILIGHHSEKSARNLKKRIYAHSDKTVALCREAEAIEDRAACVGKGGISSDDPDAIKKLQKKLHACEKLQEDMKRINREYKKGGLNAVTGLKPCTLEELQYKVDKSWSGKPFDSWELQNNNANIKRIRNRIEELKKEREKEDVKKEYGNITYLEEDNRVQLKFPGKPIKEIRQRLFKQYGFRFSKYFGNAWIRKTNDTARYYAKSIIKEIQERESNGEKMYE